MLLLMQLPFRVLTLTSSEETFEPSIQLVRKAGPARDKPPSNMPMILISDAFDKVRAVASAER
jgi:hypothetical protein